MTDYKFYKNDTFEEWANKQDKNSLEFKIIEEVHNIFSGWNIEDIKEYVPGFVSSYLKIVQDTYEYNKDASISDIKNIIFDYVSAGRQNIDKQNIDVPNSRDNIDDYNVINIDNISQKGKFFDRDTYEEWADKQDKSSLEFRSVAFCHMYYPGLNLEEIKKKIYSDYIKTIGKQKVHMEIFGESSDDPESWNKFLNELVYIALSENPPYKPEDRRGHGEVYSFRIGDKKYSFRTEMEFSRDLHRLLDHDLDRKKYPTYSDFFRDWVGKSIKIYALLHRDNNILNKFFENEINYESQIETQIIYDKIRKMERVFADCINQLEDAIRHNYSKDALMVIRDDIIKQLQHNHLGRKRILYDDAKKQLMISNRDLRACLNRLEELGLITKEFEDSVLLRGIVPKIDSWQEQK